MYSERETPDIKANEVVAHNCHFLKILKNSYR